MVQRDEDDTDGSIPLSREEMIQAAVAWGPAEAVAELPWLALQATPHTRLSDSVLEMGAAFEYLQKTMNQYTKRVRRPGRLRSSPTLKGSSLPAAGRSHSST